MFIPFFFPIITGYLGDKGYFRVSKILYGLQRPITSTVPIVDGDIHSELEYYMEKSEQIPCAISLHTLIDEGSEKILFSGGIVIQTMPDAPHELLPNVQQLILDNSIAKLCILFVLYLLSIIYDTSQPAQPLTPSSTPYHHLQPRLLRTFTQHCQCNVIFFNPRLLCTCTCAHQLAFGFICS